MGVAHDWSKRLSSISMSVKIVVVVGVGPSRSMSISMSVKPLIVGWGCVIVVYGGDMVCLGVCDWS